MAKIKVEVEYTTVGELIEILKKVPKDTPCVHQRDPEGNGYAPLEGAEMGLWVPNHVGGRYAGDVLDKEYVEEHEIEGAVPALIFWPRY